MDTAQKTLDYLAQAGEYYGSTDEIPEDVRVSKIRAMERIMACPADFPRADLGAIKDAWPALCSVAAGQLIFF